MGRERSWNGIVGENARVREGGRKMKREREREKKSSVLQCVAVCRSVLQCVAVCCSVLQCVAV